MGVLTCYISGPVSVLLSESVSGVEMMNVSVGDSHPLLSLRSLCHLLHIL